MFLLSGGGPVTTGGNNTFTGQQTFNTVPIVLGAGIINNIRVITAAGAVTVTSTDNVVVLNKTSGAATIVNLPASPTTGQTFTIKDGKGDAGTNNMTLTPAAGNIDGAATYVISTNYGSVQTIYNGTQWNVF